MKPLRLLAQFQRWWLARRKVQNGVWLLRPFLALLHLLLRLLAVLLVVLLLVASLAMSYKRHQTLSKRPWGLTKALN
jgi:hypothetical protein